MANPSGNHQEPSHGPSSINGNPNNGNLVAAKPEISVGMMHNSGGAAIEWSSDEQSVLEDGLTKYVTEPNIIRYAKIAMLLPNKTVRDVALRCRWMTKKENSKRRKEEHNLTRKSKDKKERVIDHSAKSSHFQARPNISPYALPAMPNADNDDGIPYQAIGGPMGELLKQNAQALDQISANLQDFQIQDNFRLFIRAHDNFIKIMNEFNDMPDIMKQMPPLPVKVNDNLARSILFPQSTLQI